MRRLLSLALLVALLTACGGGPATPTPIAPQPGATDTPSGDGEATISFAVWDYERPGYQALADQFMAENPGITVVIVPLDDMLNSPAAAGEPESTTAMLRRIVSAADTAPAIGITPDAYGTPLLLDLAPLMDADPNFKRDDFYPGAIERWTASGGTWALPRSFYLQILSYNRGAFQLANLPEPEAGWSWDELLATAEQLAAASGGVGDSYGYMDNSGGFLPLLAALKQSGIDVSALSARELRLDDPKLVAGFERIQQLYRGRVLFQPYASDPNVAPPDPAQLVTEGRLAIWGDLYFPGPNGEPSAPEGIDVGRVPMPADIAEPWGSGGGDGFMISGGTAYPNESWRWIEWLSRQQVVQPGQGSPAAQPGLIPARQSVAEQSGYWETLDEASAAAYRWALANPAPQPSGQVDYMALGALGQVVSMIATDPKANLNQVIDDAQKQLDEQLVQLDTMTPTPQPDTSPVLVATPEPQTPPEGATTITFAVPGFSPSEMRRITRAFREERPDIFVQIKSTDMVTGPLQLADIARTADCFTWGQPPQNEADFRALLDLRPLIDADASFPLDDYPPAVLAAFQREGGTFGLPQAFNMRALLFNRTAFDAAGIETPNGGWSTDDFLAAAQALTTGEGDSRQWGYVALGGAQQDMLFFIGQFGGRLTTGTGQDLRPNYTDPKTVEAIRWYIDLSKTHKVMPPLRLYYLRDDPGFEDKSYQYVQEGRAGMWIDVGYGMFGGPMPVEGPVGRPALPDRPFELGASALPVGTGGLRSGDITARGLHISASSQNPQACWELLKYLSTDISSVYGDFPARISVATGEAYAAQASPEQRELYQTYAEVLRRPLTPGDDQYVLYNQQIDTYWLFKAIMDTVEDKADLTAALDEAQRFTTAYAECVAGGETPPTCAAKVDPDYRGFNVEEPEAVPMG